MALEARVVSFVVALNFFPIPEFDNVLNLFEQFITNEEA
jgi:hypothetical protein